MKIKTKEIILLIFLILLILIINYSFIDKKLEDFLFDYKIVIVERVIDGDTFVSENNSIRLLGINSPERGEKYYIEAKEFLERETLNKTVRLEFGKEKYDRYKRILAYVYINRENINLKLVESGFANFYFPSGKDINYDNFENAWNECIKNNVNLCEKSKNICGECIELREFDYKNQKVVLENNCNFSCDLTSLEIKDEGRKKFIFPEFTLQPNKQVYILIGEGENTKDTLFWAGEDYVWTRTGDSLFLRDEEGKLVLWESY